ncbi:GntR family transcriptional regulator [Desulfobacula sp.]|uniref:GntR family transcriptional regulator n=1 Tax=Desulfobacula sp. TaxID=2593537 RepID=UPI0026041CEF|nr:GntR family transcriptional regulator [Desulfobacula sp.]
MEKKPLKDKVYKILRYDILTGKIPGGTHITESSIAKRLNVSRTPVREAFQRLTQERLITSLPRAGYIVESLSDEDIQDLFSARFDIERLIIERATQYISTEELQIMGENIQKSKASIKLDNFEKMTILDIEFHSIIYKASRSKALYRICVNLSDLTLKYRYGLNLEKDLWNEVIHNHNNIYQALLAKDQDKAIQALTIHAEQVKVHLLELLKKVRSESFSKG